jgi:fucose 4-O-acetylase-like acetyltransferase
MISSAFGQFDRSFRPIRMPLFFAVSGYLAAGSIRKGWRHVYSQKVLLLLYLFGLWNIIQWLLFRYTDINNKALAIGEDVSELFKVWYAPTTGLWFVWALAIYWIIALGVWNRHKLVMLSIAAAISVLFMSRLIVGPNFAQMFVLWYSPFFFGGMWYGYIAADRVTRDTIRTLIVALIIFVGATVVVNTVSAGISVGVSRLVQSTCGLVAGCAASVIASRFRPTRSVLVYIGQNTLPIFLTHEMIIELCALFIARNNIAGPVFYYLGPPVLAVFAVVASLALNRAAYTVGLGWLYQVPEWIQGGFARAVTRRTVSAQ